MASTDRTRTRPALVLFRHDLRLADNGALRAAVDSGRPVVPVFVFDEMSEGVRKIGGARRWWLHHSLEALAASLKKAGAELVLRAGPMADVAADLVKETGAEAVYWNRRYDPPAIAADKEMKSRLGDDGIEAQSFDGHLLHEPWQVKTGTGGYYKVYTPFWRALTAEIDPREPVARPREIAPFAGKVKSG
ncbi:MAG: deoxyribodipyrimidine photo-lyase, partial [Agrobacterium tumefaciens]